MTDFESLGLSPKALEAVRRLGYQAPTPVQAQTIPLALEGHDIIAGAQTGTGKTAAFCLPTMDKLPRAERNCGPLMLVVTPTRELADQISEVCKTISKVTKHWVTTVVGGVSYNPQIQALKRGTDVLIATPGRLEDLMKQGALSLDQVQVLVLDEADRMLDMGFLPAVSRISEACTSEHQTLLFSATIDNAVEKAAKEMLKDPQRVEVARRGETADTVDQYIVRISHAAKPSALKAILNEKGARRVIVFARTRHRADSCARRVKKMGFTADSIHSDKSQAQRRRVLASFDKGTTQVLVATDVLARGIDIDQVDYVVNFDLPRQAEDYVHRIGRTGRAGARGFAVSLVSPENKGELKAIQKLIKKTLPEMDLKTLDKEIAEQEAEERSMQLQARREKDPEIEKVVRELSAQKRKERKAKALAEADAKNQSSSDKPKRVRSKKGKGGNGSKPSFDNKGEKSFEKEEGFSFSKDKSDRKDKDTKKKNGKGKPKPTRGGKKAAGNKGKSQDPELATWAKNAQRRKDGKGKGGDSRKGGSGKKDMRPGRAHRSSQAQRAAKSSRRARF